MFYLLASVSFVAIPPAVLELGSHKPVEHLSDAWIILISKLHQCPRHISRNTRFPDARLATDIAFRIIRSRPGAILPIHGLQVEITTLPDLRMITRYSEFC